MIKLSEKINIKSSQHTWNLRSSENVVWTPFYSWLYCTYLRPATNWVQQQTQANFSYIWTCPRKKKKTSTQLWYYLFCVGLDHPKLNTCQQLLLSNSSYLSTLVRIILKVNWKWWRFWFREPKITKLVQTVCECLKVKNHIWRWFICKSFQFNVKLVYASQILLDVCQVWHRIEFIFAFFRVGNMVTINHIEKLNGKHVLKPLKYKYAKRAMISYWFCVT